MLAFSLYSFLSSEQTNLQEEHRMTKCRRAFFGGVTPRFLFFWALACCLASCVTTPEPEPAPVANDPPPELKNPYLEITAADLNGSVVLESLLGDAIHKDKLQLQGEEGAELYYALNPPYTGWAKEMYDNGQVSRLVQFKRGKQDGLRIDWWGNGQKMTQGRFIEGKRHGLQTSWYLEKGQKQSENLYHNGQLISATVWKPSGEKCPHSNVLDGFGILVTYHPNGQKQEQGRYEDGDKEGLWIYYSDEGVENHRETYEKGRLQED